MPFPGGDADKAGNRYEALWTVRCLLQILKGEARNITLELLGKEWQGVEFKLETSNVTEYYGINHNWRLTSLLWQNLKARLTPSFRRCLDLHA